MSRASAREAHENGECEQLEQQHEQQNNRAREDHQRVAQSVECLLPLENVSEGLECRGERRSQIQLALIKLTTVAAVGNLELIFEQLHTRDDFAQTGDFAGLQTKQPLVGHLNGVEVFEVFDTNFLHC